MIALTGGAGLKMPNREYWLAPERKADTLAFFQSLHCWLAGAVALFVGYMHWLNLRAQQVRPPQLSEGSLYAGIAVLVLVWIVAMALTNRRFKKIPPAGQA
jgi:hypothetical protein